jgi:hypothetical protein
MFFASHQPTQLRYTPSQAGIVPSAILMSNLPIPDLLIWFIAIILEAFVAYLLIANNFAGRFLFLTSYLVSSAVVSFGRYFVFQRHDVLSTEYRLFYFYSDALLTILMYCAIIELSVRIAGNKDTGKRLVLIGLCAFFVTAGFSFWLATNGFHYLLLTHFIFDLSQNLFFISLLAVILICGWIIYAGSADRMAARFAGVFGIFLSLFASAYCLFTLAPSLHSFRNVSTLGYTFLPVGFGMALFSRES